MNGYWNGFRDGFWAGSWTNVGWGWGGWGWGGGFVGGLGWGLGSGLGWGLSSWVFGAPCFSWGYANYVNPYFVPGVVPWGSSVTVLALDPVVSAIGMTGGDQVVFDYSQPIGVQAQAAPAEPAADQEALAVFERARSAFKAGEYEQALRLTDQALRRLPTDATLHEFRALTLFALGRYAEAAGVLHAVLAVGPGWDWPTLIGLYSGIATYTEQVRALEAYRDAHREESAPRFVLAYHYLTQGHKDATIAELREVVRLQPNDALSAQLLESLDARPPAEIVIDANPPEARAAAQPEPRLEAPAQAVRGFVPRGTWVARPNADTTVTLSLSETDTFTWTVERKGQEPSKIEGSATVGNEILTLASDQSGALVGQMTNASDQEFTFRLLGSPAADPGLRFERKP